jgi:hypothetical protein
MSDHNNNNHKNEKKYHSILKKKKDHKKLTNKLAAYTLSALVLSSVGLLEFAIKYELIPISV